MRKSWQLVATLAMVLAVSCGAENGKNAQDAGDGGWQDQSLSSDLPSRGDADAMAVEDADDVADGLAEDVSTVPEFPPRKLPCEFTRPIIGEPLSEGEIGAFTTEVTGLWKESNFFRWILRTSTGVDPSTGLDDYLAWYNDVLAVKAGATVTFQQKGGDHNMWIPGSKVLSEVMAGCSLTGDWAACKAAEQYCKGLTASVKGFIWGTDDPAPYLMARAIFPTDHAFTLNEETWQDDGRSKVVEFSHMYHEEHGWNAHTFAWPENPAWGSIWVTNMRSKDDVCAIVRTTGFLHYAIADAPYDWVRTACQETLDTMVGFNRDIVDSGYHIRTKDDQGQAYEIMDQDLGNYVWYADLDPLNECPARLASDLIAYGEPLTNDCGTGTGSVYDMLAPAGHYYNYPIIWNYHMAALLNALVYGHDDVALKLLQGLAERMDTCLAKDSDEPGADHPKWSRDMAVFLVQAAAVGLPLTAEEAALVHKHWGQAVDELSGWPRWDLWAPSVPDGEYGAGSGFRPPDSSEGIPIEAVAMFLEYCNSPFRNPAGARFVDCDQVADMQRWGEP